MKHGALRRNTVGKKFLIYPAGLRGRHGGRVLWSVNLHKAVWYGDLVARPHLPLLPAWMVPRDGEPWRTSPSGRNTKKSCLGDIAMHDAVVLARVEALCAAAVGLDPTVVSPGAIWVERVVKPAEILALSRNLRVLRQTSAQRDSAAFHVAKVCRESRDCRDMFCDSR